ncbi:telomeric repeat-binding factor 2-like [Archocentrus centrarchus]|uniref:telomeric repeat-binding factor 2-like n=1 Tax=Archocentrus centrarchus TaxID=63155 RepID=UPI0011E9D377|nr:telomeric repeat-binding factor 2-like [Archocentrus centrarchus]
MASKETVNGHQTDIESIVNRWLVEYYLFLVLEFYKKEQYEDFCAIRDVLESILARPLESTDDMPTKVRVLQFITRINEGEKLDVTFDTDMSITPLESALNLLENMRQEFSIPQQDYEKVSTSLKEMIVGLFIKNNEFDKAEEVLNKHFPQKNVGKKGIFVGLIRKKNKKHEVIKQINFRQFKEEMLAFCQRLCHFSIPLLHKLAKQLIDERFVAQDNTETETDEQAEPGPSSSSKGATFQFLPCKDSAIQRTRLEEAYKSLAAGLNKRTFAQLEEEVETEEQERENLCLQLSLTSKRRISLDLEEGLFQRDSGDPKEASPADQLLLKMPIVRCKREHYTVSRLVLQSDSQSSSFCTAASEELEPEARRKRAPQTLPVSDEKDRQRTGTDQKGATPTGKQPLQANRASTRKPKKSKRLPSDSEEDPQEPVTLSKTPVQKPHEQLSSDPGNNQANPDILDDIRMTDSSMESLPSQVPSHPVPQTSSTRHKDSAQNKQTNLSKWKQLYNNAKETKDVWSDEESYFTSKKSSPDVSTITDSGQRKRMWTESETQKLKDGVRIFGEGNWTKIKAYYGFKDRTNVNLKDRWRTMKKLNMV